MPTLPADRPIPSIYRGVYLDRSNLTPVHYHPFGRQSNHQSALSSLCLSCCCRCCQETDLRKSAQWVWYLVSHTAIVCIPPIHPRHTRFGTGATCFHSLSLSLPVCRSPAPLPESPTPLPSMAAQLPAPDVNCYCCCLFARKLLSPL